MKRFLFGRRFNWFDLVVVLTYARALIKTDFWGSVLATMAFIVAACFSAFMEERIDDKAVSKKAR